MEFIIFNLALAVPTFFLVKLVFKKINPTWSRLNNPLLWLSTAVVTPVVYVGLFFIWFTFATYYPERRFDKEAWSVNIETRYEYADDLVDNDKLIGLDKREIKEMLGEPEYENENSMTYYIGFSPRHLIGIDPDYLEINFRDGNAYSTQIYNS